MTATESAQTNQKIEELLERKRDLAKTMEQMMEVDATEWSKEDEDRFDEMGVEVEELTAGVAAEERNLQRIARMEQLRETGERETFRDSTSVGEMRAYRENRLPGHSTDDMRLMGLVAWANPGEATAHQQFAAKQVGLDISKRIITVRAFDPGGDNVQMPNIRGMSKKYVRQIVEERQQGTTPDTAGGYTVPQGMMQQIEVALLQFGAPRQYSDVVRTADGREVPWPTTNDTNQLGEIVAENAAVNQQDVVFGQAVTKPYMYSSKYVPVSIQLMQDSATNMQALLGRLLGERIGRIQSNHFTTGTGTGQPRGITIDAPTGHTLATAGVIASTDDIYELKHSVDPAYRQTGHGFVFADATLKDLKKLKDTQNRPLWQAGLAQGEPNTIDGDPYFINQSMPSGATLSAKIMLYGQLDKYKIHDGLDMVLRRLDEIHALNHQVTFLGFMRSDGRLLDAGTEPVKAMTNPAT